MKTAVWLFFSITAVIFWLSNAQSQQTVSCGSTYNINVSKQLKVNYHGGGGNSWSVPPNINCTWTLVVNKEAYIKASDFYLAVEDSFRVVELNSGDLNSAADVFGPYRGRQGPFVIAVTAGTYKLELNTTSENVARAFLLVIRESCSPDGIYNFNSAPRPGVIRSPMYSSRQKGSFMCSIQVSGYGVSSKPDLLLSLSIVEYNISRGKLEVGETVYDFINSVPPPMFLSKGQLLLNITINREIRSQFLTLEYEVVSESCSRTLNLSSSNKTSLISLNIYEETVALPVCCHWLVTAPIGHYIHAGSSVLRFRNVQDSLVISGPHSARFSPVLLTYNPHGLMEVGNLTVPSNYMVLKFSSPHPLSGLSLQVRVSLNSSFPAVQDSRGSITLDKLSVHFPAYNLQVDENKHLKLQWKDSIPDATVLTFYKDCDLTVDPFLELTQQYQLDSLVLPFNKVSLVVNKFTSDAWTFSFEGIPTTGCDQIRSGNAVTFHSEKMCRHGSCSWYVPPRSKDGIFQVSFPKLNLGLTGYVSLYKMDNAETPVATFTPQSNHHVINFPARSGVHIKTSMDCLQLNSIVKALVLFKPVCNHSQVVSAGESVQVESPRYPQSYPLNSDCHWQLTSPARFIALKFNQISLSGTDTALLISSKDKTMSIHVQAESSHLNVLPDDQLLEAPVNLHFQAPSSLLSIPLSSGFLLTATAFDCGGVVTAPQGYLHILPHSHFCQWSISVPENRYQKTQLHMTVQQMHRDHMKIYDGGSMRSNVITLDSNGVAISSNSKVIVVYSSSGTTGRKRLLHYVTEYCDHTNMCENGRCFQPEWHCNGINDCGDFSDEQGCPVLPAIEPPPSICSNSSSKIPAATSFEDGPSLMPAAPISSTDGGCRPSSVLAFGVTGGLMIGLVVGGILGCVFFKQLQKKKHCKRKWKIVEPSEGLTTDTESL